MVRLVYIINFRYMFQRYTTQRVLSWWTFSFKYWKIQIWDFFKAQEEAESSEDQGALQIKAMLSLIDLSVHIVNLL